MSLAHWRPLESVRAAFSPKAAVRRGGALLASGKSMPAFHLYVRAARGGFADAEYRVGRCYIEGTGVPPSRTEGVRWLEKAAHRGHADAQLLLAVICLDGAPRRSTRRTAAGLFGDEGSAPDHVAAMRWARLAAERDSGEGQALLAFILTSGPEHMRNLEEADRWYERSAASGCPQGHLGHALALARKGGDEAVKRDVVAHLRKAAEAGLPEALYLLGVASEHAFGTACDPGEAADYYRRAARHGHRSAQARLGLVLVCGAGVPANPREGETLLRRAALAGDAQAAALLGDLYGHGGQLPTDHAEAARWRHRAADAGHQRAARSLGLLGDALARVGAPPGAEKARPPIRVVPTQGRAAVMQDATAEVTRQDAPVSPTGAFKRAELCACGSGVRSCRCCDLDAGYVAPSEAITQSGVLLARAREAFAAGNKRAAEALCIHVLDLAPRVPDALWTLCRIRQSEDRQQAVLALLRRLVGADPNHLEGTQELAATLFQGGDMAAAEPHARNAVRLAPTNPRSHKLMAMILTEDNRPRPAEYHYRRAIELSGAADPILLANLAWNLTCQGRMAEARALYEESVKAAPEVFQTWLGWARLEEADRNFTAARSRLEQAAKIRPHDPGLRMERALLLSREGDDLAALAELEPAGSEHGHRAACIPEPSSHALLEKGRMLDRLQRYDEAFACFDQAKQGERAVSGQRYLDQEARELVGRLRGFFVGERVRLLPQAPPPRDGAQPIFILGFPRSGTTLVEQALSSHRAISAGDELPFINELSGAIPRLLGSPLSYPEALCELWMGDNRPGLELLRDIYLRNAEAGAAIEAGSAWFTDKMPLNEMHLGLIALIFPRSPLIHVLRHPLDVILSTFSHHLTHGYCCALALEAIARHYVLIMDLVEHYRAEMTLRYLPVRYEDVVQDMPGSMRRVLDFIGESFDHSCVDFHRNRRLPRTPSYAQVAEPLYDRSVFRYRHYLKHLEPVISIVAPTMQRLGYGLD